MGFRYTTAAIHAAQQQRLNHAAARLLLAMSAQVRDTPSTDAPEGLYFAGRTELAYALGYGNPDPNELTSRKADSAVARALADLKKTGLITPHNHPGRNRIAVYDLTPLRPYMTLPPPSKPTTTPLEQYNTPATPETLGRSPTTTQVETGYHSPRPRHSFTMTPTT